MAPIQRNLRITLPLIALLATLLTGCAGYRPVPEDTPAAVIVQPINPVRMSPDRQARVLGVVLGGMRFPVTGKAESCEFLRVEIPWWGEAWIIGPPEFATLEGTSCADLPDFSINRDPVG